MKLTISKGNMKLGGMPNLSLPPGVTCRKDAPCRGACYAQKAWRQYPNVRKAWRGNWALWQKQPVEFEHKLDDWITKHKPDVFRWHVGGDIPDGGYLSMMRRIAVMHEGTTFFAYTKRYDLLEQVAGLGPSNLVLIASRWPGLPCPEVVDRMFPRAYYVPKGGADEGQMVEWGKWRMLTCPGSCAECNFCWTMGPRDTVIFHHH